MLSWTRVDIATLLSTAHVSHTLSHSLPCIDDDTNNMKMSEEGSVADIPQ